MYSGQPEMTFSRTGAALGIEAASVVLNGEKNISPFNRARNPDARGRTVSDGVGDELTYYAEHRMCGSVGQKRTRYIEADRDVGLRFQDGKRLFYRPREVRVIHGVAAQIE